MLKISRFSWQSSCLSAFERICCLSVLLSLFSECNLSKAQVLTKPVIESIIQRREMASEDQHTIVKNLAAFVASNYGTKNEDKIQKSKNKSQKDVRNTMRTSDGNTLIYSLNSDSDEKPDGTKYTADGTTVTNMFIFLNWRPRNFKVF